MPWTTVRRRSARGSADSSRAHDLRQVDGDEVGQPRDRGLGEFLGGAAHIQGGAYAGACLGQQFQTAPSGDRERRHFRLTHQHQTSGQDVCGVLGRAAGTGSRGLRAGSCVMNPPGCRSCGVDQGLLGMKAGRLGPVRDIGAPPR